MSDIVSLGVETLRKGMKILVVGAKASNLGRLYQMEDKRLIILSSTEHDIARRQMPQSVGLTIRTRFIKHAREERLKSRLSSSCVYWTKMMSPNELRTVLEQIFSRVPLGPKPVEVQSFEGYVHPNKRTIDPQRPVVVPTVMEIAEPLVTMTPPSVVMKEENQMVKKLEKGVLKKFLAEYANLDAEDPVAEQRRLVVLGKEMGLAVKFNSLASGFNILKRTKRALLGSVKEEKAAPPKRKRKSGESAKLLTSFVEQSKYAAAAVAELLSENKSLRAENSVLQQSLKALRQSIKKAMSGN